jgi:hypothetical protein
MPDEEMITFDEISTRIMENFSADKQSTCLSGLNAFFFVDKVSGNTHQKSDCNAGGDKKFIQENQSASTLSYFQDCHFPVYQWKWGSSLVCISAETSAAHILGLKPWAPGISIHIEGNSYDHIPWIQMGCWW